MGVAILVVLGVVVVTVVRRGGDVVRPAAENSAQEITVPGGFGDRRVAIPAGAEVVGMAAAGGRLVLRLRLADGATALLMLDPATGRPLGRITFAPERP